MHDAGQNYESVDHVTGLTDPAYDLFRYDEGSSTWQNQKKGGAAAGFDVLTPGRGYIYRSSDERTLIWDGEPNSADRYNVSLTASGSDDLKGFNLVGNPYPFKVKLNRSYYSLNADGSWTAHNYPHGDSLAVGQGALVYTAEAGGETLTFYSATRSTTSGAKGALPPLPAALRLEGDHDGGDESTLAQGTIPFVRQDGNLLIITGSGTLQTFDMMGRMLFQENVSTNQQINVSAFLAAGVYLLRLNGQTQKIVIEQIQ